MTKGEIMAALLALPEDEMREVADDLDLHLSRWVLGESRRPALTGKQQGALKAIRRFIERHGYSPTIRELGLAIGVKSLNGVNDHLLALERKGWIVRTANRARSIRLL